MAKNKKSKNDPKTHDDLKGFNIHINEFGQVESTLQQDKLNTFLNDNVEDKKFNKKVIEQLSKEEE
ncbi:hypothetical protein [Membranihabitans maritimus]|uniref:hypothetical protein n=1 Tax=Membranihabitans maritimus TaxID=2904244 RepID=UPI001F42DA45|nr:hypothetical protein [Membranihabitans maritimus]